MPSSIQAHLLYAGHQATIGETSVLVENWITHNLRPDLPSTEYLPDIGDSPIATNVISGQSVVYSGLANLTCKSITETDYLEGGVRGTLYTVQYDNNLASGEALEPTNDEDTVILSISSAAQVDSYTKDPESKGFKKLYIKEGTSYLEAKNITITKVTAMITVSTTKRYRNLTPTQIIALGALAGKVNASTQWGVGAGCLLYNGHTAAPVQETDTVTEELKINWNVTNNYTVKYIPGTATDTWQHVFYNGIYSKLYGDAQGSTFLLLYGTDTLPNDLA